MSYAVGNRQFPIRDFRRAVFDENLRGNASDFSQDFHRKSLGGNCLSLIAPHSIVLLVFDTTQYSMYRYVCMYHHTYSKSMDQPGKVANPARGQLFFFFFIFHLTFSRWTSSLPSCLWSQRIFPSLSGSRLTIFYRDASSALLQLVNQWLNFTYSRSHAFRYERKNTNPTLVRIELTTSVLADVQLTY